MGREVKQRLILYAVLAFACLFVALSDLRPMAESASTKLGDVSEAAIKVYASLRVINAAISVVREAEIGISVGATGTVQPAAVLDPVDDTVERMANVVFWLALVASVAAIATGPVSGIGFGLLAGVFLLKATRTRARGAGRYPKVDRLENSLLAFGLSACLLPLVVLLALSLGDVVTKSDLSEANDELNKVTGVAQQYVPASKEGSSDAETAQTPDQAEKDASSVEVQDEGFGDWLDFTPDFADAFAEAFDAAKTIKDEAFQSAASVLNYTSSISDLWNSAEDLVTASIEIAGIYIFRLIILPLILFLGAFAVLRRLI